MSQSQTNTEIFFRSRMGAQANARSRNKSLTATVEAAVGNVDPRILSAPQNEPASSNPNPQRLLALLAWSYARELYSSAEIIARLRRAVTAGLWDDEIPDVAAISRFRIENRPSLQSCLQTALQFMAAQKVEQGFVTRVDPSHLVAEATRRIVTSSFIDAMEESAARTAGN